MPCPLQPGYGLLSDGAISIHAQVCSLSVLKENNFRIFSSNIDTCFSVLMQNDLSATEQEEFRIRCRSALDGLETLLQSLLEISKMETGLIQINKKKLPLMDTVISAVNRTYPKGDEKGIEFVFDYEKELETCMVMQDKRWLGEAVINVLDNAIKYSPGGSKIFIRLQKRNNLVRMEIEDQGIGIPRNEYHKIFQRFYRGTGWSTLKIKHLQSFCRCFFFYR